MSIRWPRLLTPSQLSQIIRGQKNPLKALEIFHEAKSRYPSYQHNGPVYATMLSILGNSGRITEMKEIIDQMKEDSCPCQDSLFAGLIKNYANAGLFDEALSLFRSLREFNCVNFTESFNTLVEIMVKESKLEFTYKFFLENFHGREIKSYTRSLNLLISTLCHMKRSDLALHIFQEMVYLGCYPTRETYRILMSGLCQERRFNEGIHLLYSMFWMISQKGCGADISVYRTLLDALCDNGKIQEAVEMLDKILRKGLKAPKKHRNLDLSQFHDECEFDVQLAKDLVNEGLIKGGVPSTDGYKAIAIDLYSEGKIDKGDNVLKEMCKKGFRPSLPIYEAKMTSLVTAGRLNEAVDVVAREMIQTNCVPTIRLHNIVIQGLCDSRQSSAALNYFEKMPRQVGCVPNKDSYSILVNGLCSDNKYEQASQVLEKMLINSHWPGEDMYDELIRGLCKIRKPYKAVMWLEEMISQAKVPDTSTWYSMVSSICSESRVNSVLERLQLLSDQGKY